MIAEETTLRLVIGFVTASGRPIMLSELEIVSVLVRLSWHVQTILHCAGEVQWIRKTQRHHFFWVGGQRAGDASGRGTKLGHGSQHQGGETLFVDQWNTRDVEPS